MLLTQWLIFLNYLFISLYFFLLGCLFWSGFWLFCWDFVSLCSEASTRTHNPAWTSWVLGSLSKFCFPTGKHHVFIFILKLFYMSITLRNKTKQNPEKYMYVLILNLHVGFAQDTLLKVKYNEGMSVTSCKRLQIQTILIN